VMECLVTAVARKGNDGTVLGYQGIIRDITERKKAEQEIRRLNKDLVGRTHELEAANKELDSFSYSVSHDLRNPLLAIDGFSRKLVEQHSQHLDAKGKQFLNIIHSQAQHLLQLIDGLLAFSHLEHQDLRCSNIDMSELAKTICNEMKLFSPEHQIQVKIGSLPEAMGDPTMIRQVLVNLLSNAYKFTGPKDGGIIEIGCITQEDQNVYYVKDNGVGFDMQFAGRLFGVFQKLHGQGEFGGTGVGLAIVQRIIMRHGGWIWAEGKVNGGATFYFSLPK
jgi:light-regulated signal transduction histidine kinase (bacteriophytochrome)